MAIQIFKGSDATITVNVKDKLTKKPVQITGFTGATGFFAQDGSDTALAVSGALLSEDCGQIEFVLSEAETALLEAGDSQSMEVIYDQGANRTILQFEEQLEIKERLF